MRDMLARWLVLALAVWVSTYIVPGIRADSVQSLLAAALVLGVLNAFAKPLLVLFSLPMLVLTLGLFLVVINALLLWLTGRLVSGFHVDGFWSAIGGALIVSVVSFFFAQRHRRVHASAPSRNRRGPPPGHGPVIDV